jgi:hypothetical protein
MARHAARRVHARTSSAAPRVSRCTHARHVHARTHVHRRRGTHVTTRVRTRTQCARIHTHTQAHICVHSSCDRETLRPRDKLANSVRAKRREETFLYEDSGNKPEGKGYFIRNFRPSKKVVTVMIRLTIQIRWQREKLFPESGRKNSPLAAWLLCT